MQGSSAPIGALCLGVALAAASTTHADFAEIKAHGVLRVLASSDESPAWFAVAPAAAPGFEREVLEGFARLHRLRIEVVPVEVWGEAIPDLIKGRGDVIAGINDTPARREQIAFTSELVPSRHVVVTRKPYRVVGSVPELRKERVGVVTGTTWAEAVTAAGVPAAQVRTFPDNASCLEALRDGSVTATVMDVVDFLLDRRTQPELQDGAVVGSAVSGAWGVRKSDPQLRRELDAYLDNLKKTPTWSRLIVQYFGGDAMRVLGRSRDQ